MLSEVWQWRHWIFAIGIVLLFVAIPVGLSPTFQECMAQQPSQEAAATDNKNGPAFSVLAPLCVGEFIEANSDPIIALFTVVLAGSTIGLWLQTARLAEGADEQAGRMAQSIKEASRAADAMEQVANHIAVSAEAGRRSVALIEANAQMQMRAYVCIQYHSAVRQNPDTGFRFQVQLVLLNAGHTPAHKVSFSASADILTDPLAADFRFPLNDPRESAGVLGPHQTFTITAVVPNLVAQREADLVFAHSGKALYIWGRVTYEDVFGKSHGTNFCQNIVWYDDSTTMSLNNARHNDAD